MGELLSGIKDLIGVILYWLPYAAVLYVLFLFFWNFIKSTPNHGEPDKKLALRVGEASYLTFKDMKEHALFLLKGLGDFAAGVAERQAKQAEEAKKEESKDGGKE